MKFKKKLIILKQKYAGKFQRILAPRWAPIYVMFNGYVMFKIELFIFRVLYEKKTTVETMIVLEDVKVRKFYIYMFKSDGGSHLF